MSTRHYTNKIEAEVQEQIEVIGLPEGVSLHNINVIFWPNYKPRGRAARAA